MESKKLLEDLISIDTTRGNKTNHQRALKLLEKSLPVGFVTKYFEYNDILTLFIHKKGVNKIDILFCGHIDVVPAQNKNQFKPYIKNGFIYGRGANDMKGPLVAMRDAFVDIKNKYPDANIGFLISSDEEIGSKNGIGRVIKNEQFIKPKVAIVPDGGTPYNIVIEEKGVLDIILTQKGKSAHSSRPWEGKNAAASLMEACTKIINKYPPGNKNNWQTLATLVLFEVVEPVSNIVPKEARARFNIRNIGGDSHKKIINDIKKLAPTTKIEVISSDVELVVDQNNQYIQSFANSVKKIVGKKPDFIKYPASCDARFLQQIGSTSIVCRPEGYGSHSEDERVSLEGLDKFSKILVDFYESNFV